MFSQFNMDCCGVGEITGLRGQTINKSLLVDFAKNIGKRGYAKKSFYIFTGVEKYGSRYARFGFTDSGYGTRFAELIARHNCGTVVESVTRVNPNSKNTIKVWIWQPNFAALKRLKQEGTRV